MGKGHTIYRSKYGIISGNLFKLFKTLISFGKIGEIMELSRYAVQRRRRKALDELRNKLAALMPKGG